MTDDPRMSVVLATDTYATIREVVRAFGRQTIADRLELVLVGFAAQPLTPDPDDVAPFAAHRTVHSPGVALWVARADGVRAATAPLVTIGETHAYPARDWAARIADAFAPGVVAVLPGFTNANPDGAISWANLIIDYGGWTRALPPGELHVTPPYHVCYRRDSLLALGARLDQLCAPGFHAAAAVTESGGTIRFEPGAVTYHTNVSRRSRWAWERFVVARVQAALRRREWSAGRRIVYVCGSPLIVPLVLRRVWRGYRAAARGEDLPLLTLPCLVMCAVFKAAGEAVGFSVGAGPGSFAGAEDIEVHKLRYARHGERGLLLGDG